MNTKKHDRSFLGRAEQFAFSTWKRISAPHHGEADGAASLPINAASWLSLRPLEAYSRLRAARLEEALGAVAPSLAAGVARRRFMAPRRSPEGSSVSTRGNSLRSARETEAQNHADSTRAELPKVASEEFELCVDGRRAPGRIWGPAGGPVVAMVHGWEEDAMHLAAFIAPLVDRGFRAVAIDMPAHGRAPGKTSNARQFAQTLLAVERRFGSISGIIAHSLGANAAAIALQQGLRCDALVLIAPMPRLEFAMNSFASAADLPQRVLLRLARAVEEAVDMKLPAFDMTTPRRSPPTLIVHDQDDTQIPVSYSETIGAAWSDARLLKTKGLGHCSVLSAPGVVGAAVAFLQGHCSEKRIDLERAIGGDSQAFA